MFRASSTLSPSILFRIPALTARRQRVSSGSQRSLMASGIVTTTRKTRGDDVDAACGQLAGQVKDKTRRTTRIVPIVGYDHETLVARPGGTVCFGRMCRAAHAHLGSQSRPPRCPTSRLSPMRGARPRFMSISDKPYFQAARYGVALDEARSAVTYDSGYACLPFGGRRICFSNQFATPFRICNEAGPG